MPFLSATPLHIPTLTYRDEPVYAMSAPASMAVQLPSPIGQPQLGFRLGVAEADSVSFFGGINYEIPISVGIHLVSIRIDGDIWRHISSSHGKSDAGGTAISADAIFGPNSSYFGAGITYAARYGGASGPSGPGIKLITGSQIIANFGYEINIIASSKGAVGAVLGTVHF